MTPGAVPLPFEADERLKATGVVGICLGYCLIGTFEPLLSVERISSRSICCEKGIEKKVRQWAQKFSPRSNLFIAFSNLQR